MLAAFIFIELCTVGYKKSEGQYVLLEEKTGIRIQHKPTNTAGLQSPLYSYPITPQFAYLTFNKFSINIATKEELKLLPGIGETLSLKISQTIHNNGPFHTKEDLLKMHGIGPEKVKKILNHINFDLPNNE